MNTEQTSKNIFTYIKTHYGGSILAKIRKLEKTRIFSSLSSQQDSTERPTTKK